MIPIETPHVVPDSTTISTPNSTKERAEMRTRTMKPTLQFQSSLAGACSALLMLCAGQAGLAQQSVQPAKAATVASAPVNIAGVSSAARPVATQAAAEEKETAAPANPGGEGIKIHGHWKFVVHDSDGKLVSTRDFENSLVTPDNGDVVLALLLGGQGVAADFGVALCPQAGTPVVIGVCTTGNPTPVAVLVPSPNGSIASLLTAANLCGGGCVSGLNKQLTGSVSLGTPFGIVLSGSYTSIQNVSINAVQTVMGFCQLNTTGPGLLNISAQTCDTLNSTNLTSGNAALNFALFTGTSLTTPQVLSAGQILTVTVSLSFS